MKKITKKVMDEMDKEFRDHSYATLDSDHAFAYHPRAMGLILEEWMNFIVEYAKDRGRDFFFATNEFQRPTVYFDSTNAKDWQEKQKLHGRDQVKFWKDQGFKKIKPRGKVSRFVKQ